MLRLTFQPNKEHPMTNRDSWTLDSIVETYKQDQRRVRGLRETTLKSTLVGTIVKANVIVLHRWLAARE
jgi:hypothetical protein